MLSCWSSHGQCNLSNCKFDLQLIVTNCVRPAAGASASHSFSPPLWAVQRPCACKAYANEAITSTISFTSMCHNKCGPNQFIHGQVSILIQVVYQLVETICLKVKFEQSEGMWTPASNPQRFWETCAQSLNTSDPCWIAFWWHRWSSPW